MAIINPTTLVPFAAIAFAVVLYQRTRERGRRQFRADTLDTLAAAVENDVAVEPILLTAVAHDLRRKNRRTVLAIATSLEAGLSLSDALQPALGLDTADHATLAAAEGTARFGPALRAVARRTLERLDTGHRVSLALIYPGTVLFGALGIATLLSQILSVVDAGIGDAAARVSVADSITRALLCALAAIAILAYLARRIPPLGRGVATIGRRLSRRNGVGAHWRAGGWLRATSAALAAGLTEGDALRLTAHVTGDPLFAAGAERAAAAVDDGATLAEQWSELGLPDGIVARAVLATREPAQLPARLDQIADVALRLAQDRRDRVLRLLHPAALVVAALLLAVQFQAVFAVEEAISAELAPW